MKEIVEAFTVIFLVLAILSVPIAMGYGYYAFISMILGRAL